MVDFTVSGLQLRFPVRFRGELTGSRWKDLRYAGHPAIRPNCLVPPAARLRAGAVQRCYERI